MTNFSPKTDFLGSRENLHLIERWTRTGPKTLAYEVTIEDPTVWTEAVDRQAGVRPAERPENRIYYEPRCVEGNSSVAAMLLSARRAERAFAEGRGPDPATSDNVSILVDIDTSVVRE